MRDPYALMMDGEGQPWDTKQGQCVFDYLIHKFAAKKGYVKFVRRPHMDSSPYDTLNAFFNIGMTPSYDAFRNGVSNSQLGRFAEARDTTLVAYDADDRVFNHHHEKNDVKATLDFRVVNNHFYPIEGLSDVNSRAQTVHNTFQSDADRARGPHGSKGGEEEGGKGKGKEPTWDWDEVEVEEGMKKPLEYFMLTCVQLNGR